MSRQKLHGFEETIRAFKNWQAGYLGPLIRARMRAYVDYVYERSQELVPISNPAGPRSFDEVVGHEVDSGHLKRSGGRSVDPSPDGKMATGSVWYMTSYATYVHEHPYQHPYHGQWKYLETASNEFMRAEMTMPFPDDPGYRRGFVDVVGLRTERGAFGAGGEYVQPPAMEAISQSVRDSF